MTRNYEHVGFSLITLALAVVLMLAFRASANREHGIRCFDAVKSAPADSMRARYDAFCVLPVGAEP